MGNINKDITVTVLMPVYNGEKHLKEAIESILNQTFTDFEFLIINDGSDDSSEIIINSYKDSRIRYIKNEKNLKLITTLNKGIDLSIGKYIVRMDADDISAENRIELLVNFMEKNPEIGVCGSYFETIGLENKIVKYPTQSDDLETCLLFYNPICHPTTIWRRDIIKKNSIYFKIDYIHAEEYKFWSEISNHSKLANIPEVLLYYREHDAQISQKHAEEQLKTAKKIRKELLTAINTSLTQEDIDNWEELILKDFHFNNPQGIIETLEKLILKSKQNKILNRKIAKKWKNAVLELNKISLKRYFTIISNPLKRSYYWTKRQDLALFLKTFK